MLFISFFDLVPESVEAVGAPLAHLMFLCGAAFFAAVVALIPEPDASMLVLDVTAEDGDPPADQQGVNAAAAVAPRGGAGPQTPSTSVRRRSSRLAAAEAVPAS
jgi:hypothetical protein